MAKVAEEVTEVVTTETPVMVEEKKVDPTKALKKEIKELKAQIDALTAELEKEIDLNKAISERSRTLEAQLNKLCLNYSKISKYIVSSTDLFKQNILMILKEDER